MMFRPDRITAVCFIVGLMAACAADPDEEPEKA